MIGRSDNREKQEKRGGEVVCVGGRKGKKVKR
jgi:hypothetical protein